MKAFSSREVLRILQKDGWIIKNQVGSHVQLVHPVKPGKVTVPHPRKNIPLRTLKSIFRQARLEEGLDDE
ncbi:MAG: type II toxin-antitoxin system HicA family toxin [Moorellaceae bacterium]